MQIDVVIAFFVLGLAIQLVGVKFDFPKPLYQSIVLFLLISIGLKGGMALAAHASSDLAFQSLAVIAFGLTLPVLAFVILSYFGGMKRQDAASIAAHYGSVSIGTYAVAVSVLEVAGIDYEPYFPLFVALLEIPAILVGIQLAHASSRDRNKREIIKEVFCNQGVFVLTGALLIGCWAGTRAEKLMPFFCDLFNGVLALFLLNMGLIAGEKLKSLRESAAFILAFGVSMPILSGMLGGLLGTALALSTGGVILLAVLGASASYIAVPAAMKVALPNANLGLAITASLGVTFPFNVIVGLPLIVLYGQWLNKL